MGLEIAEPISRTRSLQFVRLFCRQEKHKGNVVAVKDDLIFKSCGGGGNNSKTKSKKEKKAQMLLDVHNVQQRAGDKQPRAAGLCVGRLPEATWRGPPWACLGTSCSQMGQPEILLSWHIKCFISFLTCFKMKHTPPHTEA